MSPITQNSKLGRILKLKEKIIQCLIYSKTIIDGINRISHSSSIRVHNTREQLKTLYDSINTIKTIWSKYLRTIIEPHSSLEDANNAVNLSIFNIIKRSGDITSMPINSDTLHLIADLLNNLKAEIIRAIGNVGNLYNILNAQDILRLATHRRPSLPSGRPGLQYRFTVPNELPLPPVPLPLPAPPPPPTSLPIPTMNRFVPPPLTRQNNRNIRVILSPQTPPTLSNSSSSSSNSSTSSIPLRARGNIYQKKKQQLQTKKRKRRSTSHFRNTRNRTK